MTDDAAQPHRPGPTEPEATPPPPSSAAPAAPASPGAAGDDTTPPSADRAPTTDPAGPAASPPPAGPWAGSPTGYDAGGTSPPPGGRSSGNPPPPGGGPTGNPPGGGPTGGPPPTGPGAPFGGAGFTSRYGLVRPRDGRYLAGVCAAVGRATNTDPVLWRVLLAVLGFFGGIGVLVYVAAWLIIPGEGDSASPVESMLGRGRSSMSPVTVIVLSVLVAVGFGYIVTDAFRAVLLGAAILVGGALLLNRQQRGAQPETVPPTVPPGPPPGPVPPVSYPVPSAYPPPHAGRTQTATAFQPYAPVSPPGTPATGQPGEPTVHLSPAPPWPTPSTQTASLGQPPTAQLPPTYRPPFAPHGPYAGQTAPPPPPPPPAKPRPPKKPRERSALGAVTFSLIFVALGLVVVLDLLDVFGIGASAYFAAALAVIGLGLLVGTWFGRARWLIALGLVTAAALGVATIAESYDRVRGVDGSVTWAPTNHRELAVRYEQSFADAVLDLRAIDFDQQDTEITVVINFGEATVVVPPNVDVTATTQVTAGDANVFGERRAWGMDNQRRETVDLGADGPGGGKLRLNLHVNAGHMEVTR
ncbi:PspC domain-containing protein [Micromonospora zingiberis]|uniref:PspC domain-containing protein n=1 Tax=Micromonospora zingiberis TaxID=2053011 RepID=A0A4R0GPT2_9ACTN|nr:PspC domain-containing protein [Micromonospora zingiberis]TCB97508.1 PspC domain-containing protein [Micromonospora zingiberis]